LRRGCDAFARRDSDTGKHCDQAELDRIAALRFNTGGAPA
jgi:hypothetical protein